METAISLPFSIDPFGKVTITTDQKKIWGDRVRSVIGTTIGERVMRPDFGSKLAQSVFNNQEETSNQIKATISEAFNTQLFLLTLDKVDVYLEESTGTVYADITYKLPDTRIIVNTTVGIISINGNKPAFKENL